MIAGIDEAGRGPLAGPVVAAAVILSPVRRIRGLADSKSLDHQTRTALAAKIRSRAIAFGVGWADASEIDALDILQATFLAMRRAVLALSVNTTELLVDGNRLPELAGLGESCAARAIIRGDASEQCISAASIIAKTVRDSFMNHQDTIYPWYGFSGHKGYPTLQHRRLLAVHGPCAIHRRSFAPVRDLLPVQSRS